MSRIFGRAVDQVHHLAAIVEPLGRDACGEAQFGRRKSSLLGSCWMKNGSYVCPRKLACCPGVIGTVGDDVRITTRTSASRWWLARTDRRRSHRLAATRASRAAVDRRSAGRSPSGCSSRRNCDCAISMANGAHERHLVHVRGHAAIASRRSGYPGRGLEWADRCREFPRGCRAHIEGIEMARPPY